MLSSLPSIRCRFLPDPTFGPRLLVFPPANQSRAYFSFSPRPFFHLLAFIITFIVHSSKKDIFQLCQLSNSQLDRILTWKATVKSKSSNSSCLDIILTSFSSLPFPSLHYFIQNTIRKAARSGYWDLCICPTSTPSDTIRRSSRVYFAFCENLVVVLIPGQTARSTWSKVPFSILVAFSKLRWIPACLFRYRLVVTVISLGLFIRQIFN